MWAPWPAHAFTHITHVYTHVYARAVCVCVCPHVYVCPRARVHVCPHPVHVRMCNKSMCMRRAAQGRGRGAEGCVFAKLLVSPWAGR